MKSPQGFSSKIIRIYLIGASILLGFYMFAFHSGTMLTENAVMERRINMVADFHFARFQQGEQGAIAIDPLLTIYDDYHQLPNHIRSEIGPGWTGSTQVLLEDDSEFQVLAARLQSNSTKTVYAVEYTNAVEWNDTRLIFIELTIALIGLVVFLLTALYMVKAARHIALPFLHLSQTLETDTLCNFEQIHPVGEKSRELLQIIKGLNTYRSGLAIQLEREKSFTRYVSHELRTPMMIIKGAISNLRQQSGGVESKAMKKIEKATEQMQALTQTFLMLAREEAPQSETTDIDTLFVTQIQMELEDTICANEINFQWHLESVVSLSAQPLLIKAVILNLLKNAFACSVQGHVSLVIRKHGIEVIDDGVGLDAKTRSYEGFGIGLVLVTDICKKYDWRFSLKNNDGKGCTATLAF